MTIIRTNHLAVSALALALAPFALVGCAGVAQEAEISQPTSATQTSAASASGTSTSAGAASAIASIDDIPNAEVRFGQNGQSFTFIPERNDTALSLMRNVTESGRNLPIYTYEGFEGDDVMQYYDVPSRYDLPANPEHVISEQAGEVYLSAPNRVIVFYRNAQIEGDFTLIGHIENTEGLAEAVAGNPVVEGYTNKIISVNYAE